MYILILSRGYPTETNKILGIFEMDQAKALKEAGFKVAFLSTDLRSIRRKRKWGYERKTIDGIDVYGMNIPLGKVPSKILDLVSSFAVKYLYKKAERENGKPDILHAHFTHQGYLGSILKEKYNIPLVVTEHSSHMNKNDIRGELLKKGKIAYEAADKLITVSPALGEKIRENFQIESIYIPNIVDTSIFSYDVGERKNPFKFVSTGHLIPIKDTESTIAAFYNAFKDNADVVLDIFGEGSERKKLEELIENLGLEGRVSLRGECSREDIAKTYRESDVFVLSSKRETFGVAYVEALASGLPVLATKCGGPESFIDEENGLFAEVGDIDGISQNMKYIYINIDKFNKKAIAINAVKKFSAENIAKSLMDIYDNIV